MANIAIRVEGIGKRYQIGARQQPYRTMGETISSIARAPLNSARSFLRRRRDLRVRPTFWALRDLSFEVKRGEVIGVIGSNGAGKSTLLKILSRVTEPTCGFAEIHGRVGSLLEVGTGFHAELSGRENIFLNGSILGMKHAEIRRKFDDVVAFAEVEQFLDTPVKRYSSGMYLRLAFSVAAHLEPEILLVDEVLAVGDAAFQKKCLGKLQDVATHSDRTVLFVSHNMQAVQSLCSRVIHLEQGRVVDTGDARAVIGRYLAKVGSTGSYRVWDGEAPGNDEVRLRAVEARGDGERHGTYSSSRDITVKIDFDVSIVRRGLCVGFDLVTPDGITVLRSYQTDVAEGQCPTPAIGSNSWICRIPAGLLNGGQYYVCPKIGVHNAYWIVDGEAFVRFAVVLSHGVSPLWNSLTGGSRPGVIAPIFDWSAAS
jgi:lipopolysaccharide transport system ATP-binding protein